MKSALEVFTYCYMAFALVMIVREMRSGGDDA